VSELIYWEDIPADSSFVSPYRRRRSSNSSPSKQYITFEADTAGWNNKRMAMETMLALAAATGRTLVLPPKTKYHMLPDGDRLDFDDFYDMESISLHLEGLDVMQMKDFLELEAKNGLPVIDDTTGIATNETLFVPRGGPSTDWSAGHQDELFDFLRQVGFHHNMQPMTEFLVFPANPAKSSFDDMVYLINQDDMFDENGSPVDDIFSKNERVRAEYYGRPTPVSAHAKERMREFYAGREKMHVYDESLQTPKILHFPVKKGARMLTHFYSFLFFEDYKLDLWVKRVVRDHVRYRDEIFCAAAAVLEKVHEMALEHDPESGGSFDSLHVRRGDFTSYGERDVGADQIAEAAEDVVKAGQTVFVATDEFNRAFFGALEYKYNLLVLGDFAHQLEGVDPNYHGMIDQIVASRGKVFMGSFFSTFSGYINRMRGYHKDYADEVVGGGGGAGDGLDEFGSRHDGAVESYYFPRLRDKLVMVQYAPIRYPFYMREFPLCWRNIDDNEE
jgi:hypothetical protein